MLRTVLFIKTCSSVSLFIFPIAKTSILSTRKVSFYYRDDKVLLFDIDDLLRSVIRVCHVRSDRKITSFKKKSTFENEMIDDTDKYAKF